MTGRRALLAAALSVGLAATAPPPPQSLEPRFERAIVVAGPGRVAARLDRRVYESARVDLGDLRVVDEHGALVPFLIDRGEPRGPLVDVRPAIRNRVQLRDGSASAVLDFGGRASRRRLRLELSGANFRRRVAVEGSDDQATWKSIVDEAWVFAVPTREPARYESLDLPENDFPFLRVTVRPGSDERERIVIGGATVPVEGRPPLREDVFAPRFRIAEDAASAESWLLLELAARHQPFHALELDVADGRFFREMLVEGRRERQGPGGTPEVDWIEIGRGAVYRLEHEGRRRECLRVPVAGRERVLRVRLRNRDDRPLTIRGVSVRVPIERIVFDAESGRSYALHYGSPQLAAPAFDLARTVGDVAAWAAPAGEGRLGSERGVRPSRSGRVPWTERHPALLWAGLIAVVAALGALTFQAIRRAP